MKLPLEIVLTKSAAKSLNALDVPTRKRISEKIEAVAADPLNPTNSYPLQGSDKRSARVGGYRILLLIKEPNLLVVDIESRGQVYRRI
ncbi:type II toxin-antitoxin system RelE family toxin [Acidicapsa ligni]|uniref:type II toxin-antitoxin system RelE family toxin n=1 Tax=Acidicapsa ligni TaxID=542300 RepID=UPI0021E09B62|nr:type II toxin-antitoxin system RelE/ParE family toxin [Acidicapsa ligni]